MREYTEILDAVLDKDIQKQAELYFQKYWLCEDEYFEKWRPIQDSIFDSKAKYLPDFVFNVGYEIFPMVGGNIFVSELDFTSLKDCMWVTGDEYFAIAQNRNVIVGQSDTENNYNEFAFRRFKYPANISWNEMISGGIIGSEHFVDGTRDYFVYGDSGKWGKYVANSWIQPSNPTGLNPVNIIGSKDEYFDLFVEKFEPLRQLEPEITPDRLVSEWLPDSYKGRT